MYGAQPWAKSTIFNVTHFLLHLPTHSHSDLHQPVDLVSLETLEHVPHPVLHLWTRFTYVQCESTL